MALDLSELLRLTRELQRATSVQGLLGVTRAAVDDIAGFANVWLIVIEPGTPRMVRLLGFGGAVEEDAWAKAPIFPVDGDAMLEAIAEAAAPVVVEDARTDPRTDKRMVELLGNRTLVNVPLLVGDDRLGALGMGTFGEEGLRTVSPEILERLVILSTHVAAALQRVRALDAQRAADRRSDQLVRRLAGVERIESLALLAGGIAHDFNNLLTVIGSQLAFVAEAPLSDVQREDLGIAVDAARRASEMTHHLLAVSRQQALQLQPVDLNAHVQGAVRILRRLVPESVGLQVVAAPHLPAILGDPTRLGQVLTNLVVNSRDAMPEGGRITIETEAMVVDAAFVAVHPWAHAGRYVVLSVTDTGAGMPADVLEHVFDAFFTTKAHGEGTGLGLAVVHGIVQQHGGMIHACSDLGAGTTFRVYLPIVERPATEVAPKLQGQVPRGTERILVADDDAVIRQIAARVLRRGGYRVDVVEDGALAVEAAATQAYHLYLLDLVMPNLGGGAAIAGIRARHPSARILLASGYGAAGPSGGSSIPSDVAVLEKPYDPDLLLRAVRRALDANVAPGT